MFQNLLFEDNEIDYLLINYPVGTVIQCNNLYNKKAVVTGYIKVYNIWVLCINRINKLNEPIDYLGTVKWQNAKKIDFIYNLNKKKL